MATISPKVFDQKEINEVKEFLWGSTTPKQEVFSRWTQGFVFSEAASCALMQFTGGPCAVIVPVQAFIVKCALFGEGNSDVDVLSSATAERASSLLLEALAEIMTSLSHSDYFVASLRSHGQESAETSSQSTSQAQAESSASKQPHNLNPENAQSFSVEYFHTNLRYHQCKDVTELRAVLRQNLDEFHSSYGVLLYLYSILFTKGIQQMKNEVEDPSEPLIDSIHGHGSQSLVNLLLTSRATTNVWDNDKEISGLKLRGLEQQSTIGFLTLLEHMRYCEVGWFFKNPLYPIWVLGSETHLTILFSKTESLVVRDNPERNAKQVFAQFDPEGNGFISSALLEDVMGALDLVTESEYVEIMRNKMDSEGLGIITSSSFMNEFFPDEPESDMPREFVVYHYNGLQHSNTQGKVSFTEGKATLAEEIDTQFITDVSPIKLCLQTKWPTIELTWSNGVTPSLN